MNGIFTFFMQNNEFCMIKNTVKKIIKATSNFLGQINYLCGNMAQNLNAFN